MKRKVVFFAVMTIVSFVFTQNLFEFEPEVNDARSEALGRTSILSSTGSNFIFNNPSLLANLPKKNLQANGRLIFGTTELNYDEEEYEVEYPMHFKLSGISFAMPFESSGSMKFGLGAGFRTYYDEGYNEEREGDDEGGGSYKLESHGGFSILSLGGGIAFNDNFNLGASINFPFLSEYESEVIEEVYDEYYDEYVESEIKDEGTLSGTFFNLAGTYKVNDSFSLGARVRTGFEMEVDGEIEYESGYDEKQDMSDEYKYDIKIPSEIGLSCEIKASPEVSIFGEFLTRGIGEYEGDDDEIWEDSDNGYSFRAGIEYSSKNNTSLVLLRGGFFIQSVPIYEFDMSDEEEPEAEDPLLEIGFTSGIGMVVNENFTWDAFAAYSFLNKEDTYEEFDGWDYYTYDIEASYSRFKIGCGVGYSF